VTLILLNISFLSKAQQGNDLEDSLPYKFKKEHFFKNSPKFDKTRAYTVIGSGVGLYSLGMVGLYQLWYKGYPQSNFHFINDNLEFNGLDKFGHAFTSYSEGWTGYNLMKWSGCSENKSILIGGSVGFFMQMTIEIFDGYSSEWGFSPGDAIANGIGSALFIGQQFAFKDQLFLPKFSYSPSKYAQYNRELLGKGLKETFIKDYNGQTYWLSFAPARWTKKDTKFPKWLAFSLGYGIDGYTGANTNPTTDKKTGLPLPYFKQAYQVYGSIDIDLSQIKTKSKFWKAFFNYANSIKIPAPTLEWHSKNGFVGHYLYF